MSLAVWLIVKGFKPSPITSGNSRPVGVDELSPAGAAATRKPFREPRFRARADPSIPSVVAGRGRSVADPLGLGHEDTTDRPGSWFLAWRVGVGRGRRRLARQGSRGHSDDASRP